MKYALVAVLAMAPAFTPVALAQEGGGHGPPNKPIIVSVPTLPTTPVPTTGGGVSSLFKPTAELGSMLR